MPVAKWNEASYGQKKPLKAAGESGGNDENENEIMA